jgi:hypothetical protein
VKFSFSRADDPAILEQGIWVALDDEVYHNQLVLDDPGEGPAIRVASTESRLYQNAYDRVTRKQQDVIRAQAWVPPDIRAAAEREGIIAACTDWRIRDDDGKVIPFSHDAVRNLLKTHLGVQKRLELIAGNLSRYEREGEAADAENLKTSSSTYSNGRATQETAGHPGERPSH